MKYFVYLARCNDNSLYTGSCINLRAREIRHNKGKGARYTSQRKPIKIVYFEKFNNLIEARKREAQIKRWTRSKKENLIKYGHPTKFNMTRSKGKDYTGVCIIYFCHDGQGNFLMAKRTNNARDEHGRWDIGGGGLEFGDTVENTIRKEIEEEYCTDVLEHEFLGYRDVHRKHENKNTHWIALDFKVLIDKEKVKIGEPHKFEKLEWFTFDNLPDKLHSQLPNFFELYKDRL